MTQTPPVSPDFAAMARETTTPDLAALARQWVRSLKGDPDQWSKLTADFGIMLELVRSLSHAAGRAEGLEDAAKWHDERAAMRTRAKPWPDTNGEHFHKFSAESIRALASDPVAGDQPPFLSADGSLSFDPYLTGTAPAPGLAAQEVEAATHAYIAINLKGEVRAYCADDPGEKESTEAILSQWIGMGRSIERLPIAEARSRALSSPRPAQAKEGPTE